MADKTYDRAARFLAPVESPKVSLLTSRLIGGRRSGEPARPRAKEPCFRKSSLPSVAAAVAHTPQ